MHERRYNREIERLRDPQRVARMEVARVIKLGLEGLNGAKTALDIGTGSGLFAEAFAAEGMQVSGIDANPDMLPVAQEFVPQGSFHEGVAEKLPFNEGAFELAFMGLVMHETDDPLAAFQEAYRVTTRRFVLLEWPEEVKEFGPPSSERMSAETVSSLSKQAGFQEMETVHLDHLVLYRLEH